MARSMEEMIPTNNNPPPPQQGGGGGLESNNQRRLTRPQKDQSMNCPRCNSTNTKFCYYNNYSLTQPRYFCKACRRYWTQGGSLRNVPVGGGSRKNKRSTPPSSSIAPTSSSPNTIPNHNMIPDLNPPNSFSQFHQNPSNKIHPHPHPHHPHHHGQDLNLAFPTSSMINQAMEGGNKVELPNSSCSAPFSALELLRTGMSSSSGLSSQFAMPDSNALYTSSGFPSLQEMKPVGFMGFPSPAHGLGLGPSFSGGSLQENSHQNAKLLFPFGDVSKFSTHQNAVTNTTARSDQADDHHQSIKGSTQDHHQHQGASGYWNGMLGGTW